MNIPEQSVLDAFRLTGRAVPLAGGQGLSVRVGDAVLKPAERDSEIVDWTAEVLDTIHEQGFRVARPIRNADGAWSHGGWTASRYVVGEEPDHAVAPRWSEIIDAGRAFHRALAGLPRPGFLDRRANWWETGNKVAWQERKPHLPSALQGPYEDLVGLLGPPPRERSQLIHGDLTGNVLFAPGLAPAVIDFSPYWRPAAFGEAVVVGDALIWHGADTGLLTRATRDGGPDFVQYVVRAIVFRLVTTGERLRDQHTEVGSGTLAEVHQYEHVARLVADFAGTGPG
ncbi:aminoglycoside phosphotransferase [Streptomyces sp. LN785]|uniref:aminoglycoside phosphotransferase n=1 Tax=Streptomyces sp. LN785 TaxID=3112983 RepID=UPI0037115BE5